MESATFYLPRVCSCGKCEDLKCEGKDYHTKYLLTCPFHSLAYEIECHERAEMAKMLVHSTLKRGHSNWLEASHNVFIRFRPKHIHLERLHYVVSTELALLQSNMTYLLYEKCGPQYHWVIELFRLLKLPVFDGVHVALEAFNQQRKAELDRKKTDSFKHKRIELKVERTLDSHRRKEWSKKHGHDTYGDIGDSALGHPLVELFLHYLIPATLTEMLSEKKSSIEIIANTERGILPVKATCHPRTVSRCNSKTPRTKFCQPSF